MPFTKALTFVISEKLKITSFFFLSDLIQVCIWQKKKSDAEYSGYDHERNQTVIYDSLHLGDKRVEPLSHLIGLMGPYVVCGRHYFTCGVVRLCSEERIFCDTTHDVVGVLSMRALRQSSLY